MNADIKGALSQINKTYRLFEHKGKSMSKDEVTKILKYGLAKGYEHTGQLTDDDVDNALKPL